MHTRRQYDEEIPVDEWRLVVKGFNNKPETTLGLRQSEENSLKCHGRPLEGITHTAIRNKV